MESHYATTLAKAMAFSLLDSLEFPSREVFPGGHREIPQDTTAHILDLAIHLQSILGRQWTRQIPCPLTALPQFPHGASFLAISGPTQ